MIALYGYPFSGNTRRVHWALEELGLRYEFRTVDLRKGDHKQLEFLKLNPNGRVPVIDDDGFVLYESAAILMYLSERYADEELAPVDARLRAQVYQWLSWQLCDFGPIVGRGPVMKIRSKIFGAPVDEKAYAEALAGAKPKLELLDAHLAGKSWVAADRFSMADIAMGETAALLEIGGVDLAPYGFVRQWIARFSARPAFQKTRPPK
jgi:glutathione S-transferase